MPGPTGKRGRPFADARGMVGEISAWIRLPDSPYPLPVLLGSPASPRPLDLGTT
jgi:hypothetical protein